MMFSFALHLGVAALAVVGLPVIFMPEDDSPKVIPVELVTVADKTTLPPPEPKKEPEPKAEPEEKPEPKVVEKEPPPLLEPPPPPKAKPSAPPQPPKAEAPPPPQAEPKPEPKPKDALTKVAESVQPRAKPRPPSRFDASQIAALIDKSAKTDAPQRKEPAKEEKPEAQASPRRSSLDAARLTASLQDLMRSQIEPCWLVPAGARDAGDLKIRIRIVLNPDGSLARPPEILDRLRMNLPGEGYFRAAAESARKAVEKCEPLKLPVDSYDIWRDTELIFDPSDMLEG